MRALALIVIGAALVVLLFGIMGGGGPGSAVRKEVDDRAYADRIGLTHARGAAPAGESRPMAVRTGIAANAAGQPPRATGTASPWSAPADFAPVDPIR